MFRNRIKEPNTMIRIGLVCLILANLSQWFLNRADGLWRGLADGATGVMWGLAFGFLLLGAWLNGRRRSGACSRFEKDETAE